MAEMRGMSPIESWMWQWASDKESRKKAGETVDTAEDSVEEGKVVGASLKALTGDKAAVFSGSDGGHMVFSV